MAAGHTGVSVEVVAVEVWGCVAEGLDEGLPRRLTEAAWAVHTAVACVPGESDVALVVVKEDNAVSGDLKKKGQRGVLRGGCNESRAQ